MYIFFGLRVAIYGVSVQMTWGIANSKPNFAKTAVCTSSKLLCTKN